MARILVVEDEPAIAMGLHDDLTLEGHTVEAVADGVDGERLALEGRHDLLLLDIMLPGKDGLAVCRTLRAARIRTPIILLTARGQEIDKVLGLELGADDYVTKPFSPRELVARINAVLRRTHEPPPPRAVFSSGNLTVDFVRFEAFLGTRRVDLTAPQNLRRAATTDALTQLANRAAVTAHVHELFDRRHAGSRCALLFIDLDNFKQINDTLGHDAGDTLLADTASRLSGAIRDADTVLTRSLAGRFGGDEFVVVLEGLRHREQADIVASRILKAMSVPFALAGQQVQVRCSIGISLADDDVENADTLFRRADVAMYRAKALGKAAVVVFDDGMRSRGLERPRIAQDIQDRLAAGSMRAGFTPIVDIATGRVRGVAAAPIWRATEDDETSDEEYHRAADDAGLLTGVAHAVFTQAVDMARLLRDRGAPALPITVAVSGGQFANPEHRAAIDRACADTAIRERLRLALDEQDVAPDRGATRQLVLDLHNRGVRFTLGRFGGGLLTLGLLRTLPLDGVTLDRWFGELDTDAETMGGLQSLVLVSHSLGQMVCGGGVEREAQIATLRALNCDTAEGPLFGVATTADELLVLTKADHSVACRLAA